MIGPAISPRRRGRETPQPIFVLRIGAIREIIICGGENIAPKEIEDLLRRHPKIADVYVYGLPDERLGEEIAAAIRLNNNETMAADEVRAFCDGKLARFKIPRHIRFVESFPMTASGNVQKFKLREIAIEEMGLAGAPGINKTKGSQLIVVPTDIAR